MWGGQIVKTVQVAEEITKGKKGCIDYKVQRLTARCNDKQLQSNLETSNNTNTHRKPRAQVLRAFVADLIVIKVDARQRIVLL